MRAFSEYLNTYLRGIASSPRGKGLGIWRLGWVFVARPSRFSFFFFFYHVPDSTQPAAAGTVRTVPEPHTPDNRSASVYDTGAMPICRTLLQPLTTTEAKNIL